ncbi:galectin-4-like [Pantherophis guttatus]|uniref:Galectin n=1 Tax=Pantherophis guttatus TaxID=94885 RepID=A0A6P9DS62_PANGU|nr:galectin-4-like [Pantherophis guttatus]
MHIFLIFALTFTLSAQQDSRGTNDDCRLSSNQGNSPGINTGSRFSSNQVMLPFKNIIPGGLKPKMTFIIRGFVPWKASSFGIDFVAGPDIALHINPRLSQGTVVRNSFLKGSWGPEELDLPFNPFEYGKFFELSISCGKYQFIVYANDEFLFSYTHRYIDFQKINTLKINGDVIFSYIQY